MSEREKFDASCLRDASAGVTDTKLCLSPDFHGGVDALVGAYNQFTAAAAAAPVSSDYPEALEQRSIADFLAEL